MEWDDVRVYLAALRSGNIRQAATALEMDRSTASRRLAALETALGAPLFVRSRDGLRPTAAGEQLRAAAEQMELSALTIARDLRRVTPVRGVVRLAVTESMASRLVAQGLLDLPGATTVELIASNHPVELPTEADLAVRSSKVEGAELKVRCLVRFEIGLMASRAYLEKRGKVRTLDDLAGHDVLVPCGELARVPEALWLSSRTDVRVAFRSNSMPALVAAALAGKGVVPMAIDWGLQEGLQLLLPLQHLSKRPMWIVSHQSSANDPAVKAVAERVARLFAS